MAALNELRDADRGVRHILNEMPARADVLMQLDTSRRMTLMR